MFAALALAAYLVQPGDTLSGIAASHGVSLAAVESANPQFSNPNLIYVGQTVRIPGSSAAQGSTASESAPTYHAPSYHAPTHQASTHQAPTSSASAGSGSKSYSSPSGISTATTPASSTGSSSSAAGSSGTSAASLANVPGVPTAFAACVAFRESTNLQNPAANGNAYGIIPASGYNVYGTSIAHQKQVFALLYAKYGTAPWAPSDGC